jgi:pimeloyl-ACP methyl ester carboxylesterase
MAYTYSLSMSSSAPATASVADPTLEAAPVATLAHDRRGSGPALVLLHPLGADRQVWRPVTGLLAGKREVIAVDLPGFGGSPILAGDGAPDPGTLARAMAPALEALAPDGYHVAGNSLGGWIALELALAGHARSVTAIAPAGLWPEALMPKRGVARAVARLLLPAMPALTRTARGRRIALAATVADAARVPPADALALVRAYVTAPGFAEVNAAMRASTFRGLEHIRVPVTLGWPEYDRLVARPAHLPPSVRSVALPGCGHVPMWDDPERVASLLLRGSR